MRISIRPEPSCTCTGGKVDELCSVHGVFAQRWSGGGYSLQLPQSAAELERRERARRRRLKLTKGTP